MFDDQTETFRLAVELQALDITLSVDHMAKLEEEGYIIDDVEEAVVEYLIESQDMITEEMENRTKFADQLNRDLEYFEFETNCLGHELAGLSERLTEYTS